MSETVHVSAQEAQQHSSEMEVKPTSKTMVSSDDEEMKDNGDSSNDSASVSSEEKIMMEVEQLQNEASDQRESSDVEMKDVEEPAKNGRTESSEVELKEVDDNPKKEAGGGKVEVDEEVDEISSVKETNVLDLDRLFRLLEHSKSAGNRISKKRVLLLIGRTGVGKTTTGLYLAGAHFKEIEVDGRDHFEPLLPLPSPTLMEFVVSGSVQSVTKTIHAVPITLADGSSITLCDTPGFGDSAGAEMDISNGLGIVHALHQAESVTPVLVLNFQTMSVDRYQGLRNTLDTVRKMMGSRIDFLPFGYAFTNCEGRNKKRVHKQLTAFLNGSEMNDPVLTALVKDMIQKTKPEAIAIDPMDHEAASEVLEDLLMKQSSKDPKDCFVPFVAEQSLSKLKEQILLMSGRMRVALNAGKLKVAFRTLEKFQSLNNTLGLDETKSAFELGKNSVREWLNEIQAEVKEATEQMVACNDIEQYEKIGRVMRSSIERLVRTSECELICSVLDFSPNSLKHFLDPNADKLFKSNLSKFADTPVRERGTVFQTAIGRHHHLCSVLFKDTLDEKTLRVKTAVLSRAVFGVISSELAAVKSHIKSDDDDEYDASSGAVCISWVDMKDSLIFILDMHSYFESSDILTKAGMNEDGPYKWPSGEVQALISTLVSKAKLSTDLLEAAVMSMSDLIENEDSWAYETSFPQWKQELVDARELLLVVSSENVLRCVVENDESLVCSFDEQLCAHYLPKLSSFIDSRAQDISKTVEYSDTTKLQQVLQEAQALTDMADKSIQMCSLFWDVNAVSLSNVKDVLSRAQERLKCIVEDAANTTKQQSRPARKGGNAIKASEKEIAEIKSAKTGAIWYNRYLELVKYQRKNGHCNVPRSVKPLGKWVDHQRQAYNKGKLPEIRETVLEKLGFLFDASHVFIVNEQEKWLENYKKLESFQMREGKLPSHGSGSLGSWLSTQRKQFKKWRTTGKYQRGGYPESMVEDRFEKLNAIGAFD